MLFANGIEMMQALNYRLSKQKIGLLATLN